MTRKRKPARGAASGSPPPPTGPPLTLADLGPGGARLPSPDGRFIAAVHDPWEYRMGWTSSRIALADGRGRILETFDGILRESERPPIWSPDSRWLAFPATAAGRFFYLVWDVTTSRFGVAAVANPYPLAASVADGVLRLEVDPLQVAAANSQETVGAGRSQAPVRRFRPPAPVELALEPLARHGRDALASVGALLEAGPEPLDLGLVADGFHDYDGPGLSSTTQRINGRALEVHHLEAFADHGDEVARAWLAEVRERTGQRYDRWATVRSVLGSRTRPGPPPPGRRDA